MDGLEVDRGNLLIAVLLKGSIKGHSDSREIMVHSAGGGPSSAHCI